MFFSDTQAFEMLELANRDTGGIAPPQRRRQRAGKTIFSDSIEKPQGSRTAKGYFCCLTTSWLQVCACLYLDVSASRTCCIAKRDWACRHVLLTRPATGAHDGTSVRSYDSDEGPIGPLLPSLLYKSFLHH